MGVYRLFTLLGATFVLHGCLAVETPYRSGLGLKGGIQETQISTGSWQYKVETNAYTSMDRAVLMGR
jgi:hypothetical protein